MIAKWRPDKKDWTEGTSQKVKIKNSYEIRKSNIQVAEVLEKTKWREKNY